MRIAGLVARAEHEVVDDQLAAAIQQLRQRPRAVVGVEPVFLPNPHPGQLTPLLGDLVAQPCVLLLARKQLLACGKPLLTSSSPLIRHGFAHCFLLLGLTSQAAWTNDASWRSIAFAALPRQLAAIDADIGSGKMSSSSFSTPSRMARATDFGEAFGRLRPRVISVSVA